MFKIVRKEILNQTTTLMEVNAPFVARKAEAGQFIILRVNDSGERIPLTIADYDRENGTVTIIFQVVGATTMLLNTLQVGDEILDFVGPLGKPTHTEGYQNVCVVGGGVGCAIAYPVAKKFCSLNANVTSIIGFRNKDLVILEDKFSNVSNELILLTDDGSKGRKGLVTNALEELILNGKNFDLVIAIGPLVMMKYVSEVTKKYNIKTVVSMNPIMIDGTGMCGGCRLTVDGKMKFACVDGPEFDGSLVDFDEAILRNKTYKKQEEISCNLMKKEVM